MSQRLISIRLNSCVLYSKYKSTYFQTKKNNLTGLTFTEKLAFFNLKKDRSIVIFANQTKDKVSQS